MSPGTSILKTCHYLDLSSASDWLKQISLAARPIRSTTLIWVMTRHQNGISALVSKTTFRGETSGGVATCRLFQVLAKGRAQEQLYDNWQQNVVDYTFFNIGYDRFCLCCLVISQKNVDEMLNTSKTYQNHQWPNLFHFLMTNILTTGCWMASWRYKAKRSTVNI